jgi:hypothetical protein
MDGIILNKYGALAPEEIGDLFNRIRALENTVKWQEEEISNLRKTILSLFCKIYPEMAKYRFASSLRQDLIEFISDRFLDLFVDDFNKLKELTHVDEYEWQETPAITKLIKKEKK